MIRRSGLASRCVAAVTGAVAGLVFLAVLLAPRPQAPLAAAAPAGFPGAGYVGSETCAGCHHGAYDTFRTTGHPVKVRPAADARAAGLPKPGYVSWDDILFVIGGFRWKARYVNQEGFIITGSADGKIAGRNQFNLETSAWTNYNAGQKLPYDCGECHTTGYTTLGRQLRKPGLIGTWALNGIQCEACHGRGAVHAANPAKTNIKIDRSAASCGSCHRRGTDMSVIPAAGGFIEHREQYQEFLQSPHRNLTCVSCHDPHRRAGEVKATCESCHARAAEAFRGSRHQRAALTCATCHMPNIVRNAVIRSKYEADEPSHLFRLNLDPTTRMFTDDGRFVRTGSIALAYSCLRCHADRTQEWAAGAARGIHTLGK